MKLFKHAVTVSGLKIPELQSRKMGICNILCDDYKHFATPTNNNVSIFEKRQLMKQIDLNKFYDILNCEL